MDAIPCIDAAAAAEHLPAITKRLKNHFRARGLEGPCGGSHCKHNAVGDVVLFAKISQTRRAYLEQANPTAAAKKQTPSASGTSYALDEMLAREIRGDPARKITHLCLAPTCKLFGLTGQHPKKEPIHRISGLVFCSTHTQLHHCGAACEKTPVRDADGTWRCSLSMQPLQLREQDAVARIMEAHGRVPEVAPGGASEADLAAIQRRWRAVFAGEWAPAPAAGHECRAECGLVCLSVRLFQLSSGGWHMCLGRREEDRGCGLGHDRVGARPVWQSESIFVCPATSQLHQCGDFCRVPPSMWLYLPGTGGAQCPLTKWTVSRGRSTAENARAGFGAVRPAASGGGRAQFREQGRLARAITAGGVGLALGRAIAYNEAPPTDIVASYHTAARKRIWTLLFHPERLRRHAAARITSDAHIATAMATELLGAAAGGVVTVDDADAAADAARSAMAARAAHTELSPLARPSMGAGDIALICDSYSRVIFALWYLLLTQTPEGRSPAFAKEFRFHTFIIGALYALAGGVSTGGAVVQLLAPDAFLATHLPQPSLLGASPYLIGTKGVSAVSMATIRCVTRAVENGDIRPSELEACVTRQSQQDEGGSPLYDPSRVPPLRRAPNNAKGGGAHNKNTTDGAVVRGTPVTAAVMARREARARAPRLGG